MRALSDEIDDGRMSLCDVIDLELSSGLAPSHRGRLLLYVYLIIGTKAMSLYQFLQGKTYMQWIGGAIEQEGNELKLELGEPDAS